MFDGLGVGAAAPLYALLQAAYRDAALDKTSRVLPVGRDEIFATIEACGEAPSRDLLVLTATGQLSHISELVAATMGWNEATVRRRVRNNVQGGIAALGLLPLTSTESVLDRYLALREAGKRGLKFGPERRLNHAAAAEAGLVHLAMVAGYDDASGLELDMESRITGDAPTEWQALGYTIRLDLGAPDPALRVANGSKTLATVPAALRKTDAWAEARELQERVRDQRRRLRNGLIERLVATGGTISARELALLRTAPAGASLVPGVIWRDGSGAIGLLDGDQLVLLDGTSVPGPGPLTAVHPFHLYETQQLAAWQREIVRRRIVQPVKQAFRELYVLTEAERVAVDASARFRGHIVSGRVAAQLLSGRGWRMSDHYDEPVARRRLGDLTAILEGELLDAEWMAGSRIALGTVSFLRDGVAVPFVDVPPVFFSETMRDIDLVVGVAADDGESGSATGAVRGQLLHAIIEDLGLDRVTVDRHVAVVRGSRATYRVHLGSGSIHIEPAGYLCIVPATFGAKAPANLVLPFVDDTVASIIVSKVLLLAADERITDPLILSQINRLVA